MIVGTLERLQSMKEDFVNDPDRILNSFRDNKLSAVRMKRSSKLGCKVKIEGGFFVVTPDDIEKMPTKTRGVFEDIFDELLQEALA